MSSVGTKLRVVARASGKHLPAQPRVLIHFEHVDAGMRHFSLDEHRQRLVPRSERLPGKPRDQIDIQIGNSCRRSRRRSFEDHGLALWSRPLTCASRSMNDCTPRLTRFTPGLHSASNVLVTKLTRCALDRDLHIRALNVKFGPHCGKQFCDQFRLQQARRPAAQIDRVDGRGRSTPIAPPTVRMLSSSSIRRST